MINIEKSIVLDIDGTLCPTKLPSETYGALEPYPDMVQLVRQYKQLGFYIILNTSRNMKTHNGNVGRINADTLKTLLSWLEQHDIPYDEIHVAKPWPGDGGFIVDDKAIRPSEFRSLTYEKISSLLALEDRPRS